MQIVKDKAISLEDEDKFIEKYLNINSKPEAGLDGLALYVNLGAYRYHMNNNEFDY